MAAGGSGTNTETDTETTTKKRQRLGPAIWATVKLLPTVDRRRTAWVALTVVIAAAIPSFFKVASGALVGSVFVAAQQGSHSAAGHRVVLALVAVGVLYILQQTVGPIQLAVADGLGRRVSGSLRERAMAASVLPPGIAHLEDPAMLDKVALAQGVGTGTFTPRMVVGGLAGLAVRYLSAFASVVLLWPYHWWMALGLAVVFTATIQIFRQDFFAQIQVVAGQAQTLRRSAYFRDLALTPGAAKEARVFGLGSWVSTRFRESWVSGMAHVWLARRNSWKISAIGPLIFMVTEFAIFFMLGRSLLRGEISPGQFTVYLQAAGGIAILGSLSNDDMAVQFGVASIPPVLELEEAVASPSVRLSGSEPAAGLPRQTIRFENVGFHYPGQERAIYDGLDLEIAAGSSLAIVGENGAGKTTLVKLLARLYDPTEGRITVDGTDLRLLDPAAWQRRLAAIFQDFVRYELPARDNVCFGAVDVPFDEARFQEALSRAGALGLLDDLPHGWDTVLSRQFTEGTDLSGGQWQRLALARALYAADAGAGVLVLDEPTANLDVRAEADIYDRFLDLTAGMTTILISHRFSTVRRAARIVVLEHGRVSEQGTHDELLALEGRYAHMFRLQASRFTDIEGGDDGDTGGDEAADEVVTSA
jgi:ABC-type multidrug transport system fused ATPase/permease subunit